MGAIGHTDRQRERVVRGAFDVVAAAQRATTLEVLNATVHDSFLGLGFSTYVGLNVLKAGGRRSHGVLFGATHPGWEHQIALSDQPGQAKFEARTHHHVGRLSDVGELIVEVRRGDDFMAEAVPDAIKIDVEGFELEVLRGMPEALARVRAVFIEVHFSELASRGLVAAPKDMTALLRAAGLIPRWIDASHLIAERPST